MMSAILFASILFEPKMGIYIDNIGHTAHFWGALYGLAFPLVCRPDIFGHFLCQLGL